MANKTKPKLLKTIDKNLAEIKKKRKKLEQKAKTWQDQETE